MLLDIIKYWTFKLLDGVIDPFWLDPSTGRWRYGKK